MYRRFATVTGLLTLALLLSTTLFAAAPTAAAAPKGAKTKTDAPKVAISAVTGEAALNADKDFGYYIWYDGTHFQLRTTDRGNGPSPSEYTGTITVHGAHHTPGTVTDVHLLKAEADDSAVASGDKLDVRFKTYNGIDGVSFTANDAKSVTFSLYRDGHLVSADHIYLGAGQTVAPGNPFRVYVGK